MKNHFVSLIIVIVATSYIFHSCTKDPGPLTFATVKVKHPLEGTYEGTIHLQCDSIGLNKTYTDNTLRISSFSLEELCINNSLCVGIAYPSTGEIYNYGQMQWIDVTDCGQLVSFNFYGSGHLKGDSLIENGYFIVFVGRQKFTGNWKSESIKTN